MQTQVLRIVVSSPNDVNVERDAVDAAVANLNPVLRSANIPYQFVVSRWERDAIPGMHPSGPIFVDIAHRSRRGGSRRLVQVEPDSIPGQFGFVRKLSLGMLRGDVKVLPYAKMARETGLQERDDSGWSGAGTGRRHGPMNRIRRAFVITGSLIVLLFCGQAIAGPIFIQELLARALEKSHAPQSMADEVWRHLQGGQITEALRLLNVRAAEHRAVGSADGLAAAKALDDAVTQIQKEKIDQAWTARIQQTGQSGQGLPDIRRLFAALDDEQLKVIRPLDDVATGAGRVRFVLGPDVKRFARNFEQGGRNPQAHGPVIDKVVPDWFNKEKGKRVFLIGAGVDRKRISEIKVAWQRDGYATFFYEDCIAAVGVLCSEGVVGAFMGTADNVFLCALPGASSSRYVSVEADVAWLVRNGGQTMILMVTPQDIFSPLATPTARAFVLSTNASQ